jgi:hypothetical protein
MNIHKIYSGVENVTAVTLVSIVIRNTMTRGLGDDHRLLGKTNVSSFAVEDMVGMPEVDRLERILTMVYVVQNSQNFSGLSPSSDVKKTRRFGNWICFRPQVKVGKKTPTQLGPND